MFNHKIVVLTLLCLICFSPSFAQHYTFPHQYLVKQFGEDEGLPQNTIVSMLPDKQGYLWIGTESGVVKFNGNRFYKVVAAKPELMPHPRIGTILRGNGDTVMVLDAEGYFSKIVDDHPVSKERYNYKQHGLVMINGAGKGLHVPETREITVWKDDWVTHRSVLHGFFLGNDSFIVFHRNGLGLYDKTGLISKEIVEHFDHFNPAKFALFGNVLVYIDEVKRDFVFFKAGTFAGKQSIPFTGCKKIGFAHSVNSQAYFLAADSMLFEAKFSGSNTLAFEPVMKDLLFPSALSSVYLKDENTIVASTISSGLFVYTRKKFNTLTDPDPNAQSQNIFYSQLLLADNKTILAGLELLFSNQKFAGIFPDANRYGIYYPIKDREGFYWFKKDSFICKSKTFNEGEKYLKKISNAAPIFFETKDNRMLTAVGMELGYFQNDKYSPIPISLKEGEVIASVCERMQHEYIIGTNTGIYILDNTTNEQHTIPEFVGKSIRSILGDGDRNIWVCTYGNGFYLIKDKIVTHFPIDADNKIAYVHSFIEDGEGRFWMPSNRGLFVASKSALLNYASHKDEQPFYYYFDKSAGFLINEFNLGSLFMPDSLLSLSSMKGLVQFYPDQMNLIFPQPNIGLFSIFADGKPNYAKDNIQFNSHTNNISFIISYAFWGNPANKCIEYQLKENNEAATAGAWFPVDRDGDIRFSGLKYGKYMLNVRIRNGLGNSDFDYKKFSFTIAPAWYQTVKFLAGSILLVAVIIFILIMARLKYLVKSNKQLQRKIEKATEEISTTNRKLEQQVILKDRLITIFSHDISVPIYYTGIALNRLIKLSANNKELKSGLLDIGYTFTHLQILTEDLITWIKVQQQQNKFYVDTEDTNLDSLINEKWQPLSMQADMKKIELKKDFEPTLMLHTDKKILGIILYNLMSNSIKFAENGTVSVRATIENQEVTIVIEDTGRGFTAGQLEAINNFLDLEHSNGTEEETGRGMGLRIAKDLITVLEGKMSIKNGTDKGAVVTLQLVSRES